MKLLLSSLLLASFCARSSWSVSSPGSPAVTQSPDVSVVEGEAVNITCCWTLDFDRMRVRWLKNQTEIKKEIFDLKNGSRGSLLKETSGCSHLTLMNVRREDSGRYICKVTVEVPSFAEEVGNGTVITVTARDNTKDNAEGGVSSPGSPAVTQSPDVSVVEGEAVNITCCWTLDFDRMRVRWLKNQTEIKKEIFDLKNGSRGSLLKETSGCSHLTLTNVRREDSGRYICKVTVEVPSFAEEVGNGTVITVTARDNTKDNAEGGVSSPGSPAVTQSPDVSVVEGEAVNITCCWTLDFDRMRVHWLKNQTYIKNEIFDLKNVSPGSLLKETSGCSHLTLTNVRGEDSGRYICKVTVEVPSFAEEVGNGTVITVTTRDNTAGGSHWEEVLIYVLRCLPILALFIAFFCINSLATKAQQHSPAAPGIEHTSAQRREENREEEERDEM